MSNDILTSNAIWAIGDFVLLIFIILGNALTILAVYRCRRLRAVTSNRLILSLAAADLLVGLAVLYHLLFFIGSALDAHRTYCVLRFVMLLGACLAGIFNVTSITFDRYIAIVHPLKYHMYVTKRVINSAIVISWIAAVLVSSVPLYWNNYEHGTGCQVVAVIPRIYVVVVVPMFLTMWLTIVLFYWKIWNAVRTLTKRSRRNRVFNFNNCQKKSNQVVLLILGCFTLCWLPYVGIVVIHSLKLARGPINPNLYRIIFWIAMCNSAVNPLIYTWKNPKFRMAFRQLICPAIRWRMKESLRMNQNKQREELECEARNEFRPVIVLKTISAQVDKNALLSRDFVF